MPHDSRKCRAGAARRRPIRRGTTLIEVLAGLVVLGTVLVSVTIARGRFLRQWGDAQRRLAAIHAADALLAQWMAGPAQAVPVDSSATFADAPDYIWRTHPISDAAVASLSAAVVRLDVYERVRSTSESTAAARAGPLLSVDFLLHVERRKPAAVDPQNRPTAGGSRSLRLP